MKWFVLLALLILGLSLITIVPVEATDTTITAKPPIIIPTVESGNATGIGPSSAVLHGNVVDTGGEDVTTIGFDWGFASGNYPYSWNTTGTYGAGAFEHGISSLPLHTQVFWRAFAINGVGQGNSTEMSFWTLGLPLAPTDFMITQVGYSSYNISWTMGIAANTTMVRVSETGYPESATGGILVYSGSGTWVVVDGLDPNMTTYYYCAWSHNDFGYSLDYAEATLGNPLGIPQVLFAVGLCGYALWKKGWIRILLAICLILWAAFAMPYDIKIAAPLLSVGIVLLTMATLKLSKGGEV